jgi:hypothetical protein
VTEQRVGAGPLERSLSLALKTLLVVGLPLSAVLLVFESPKGQDALFLYSLAHLLVLQLAAFWLIRRLRPLLDRPWFGHLDRSWLASAASLIALVTGFAALLTIASSAAARYDVSLQFLQLLSSLDIAWAVSALYLGADRIWGRRWGDVAAVGLILACVGSIAVYLGQVGFGPDGEWLVRAGPLLTVVLPSDTMAAVLAVSALLVGSSRQPRVHLSPQS